MRAQKPAKPNRYRADLPAVSDVERLEAACQEVILLAGGDGARATLKGLLHLDVSAGLDPNSPAASLVNVAGEQIDSLAAILDEAKPDGLALRVATARLCQTLTIMRGHLDGGHRTIGAARWHDDRRGAGTAPGGVR